MAWALILGGSICGPEPRVNRRVTQLCPNFLFHNCRLPGGRLHSQPGAEAGVCVQHRTGFRRGSPPLSPRPVHAGVSRSWGRGRGGGWGGASEPSPHPDNFLRNQLPKRYGVLGPHPSTWVHTQRCTGTHQSCGFTETQALVHTHEQALACGHTQGSMGHMGPHGVLVKG